MKRQLAVGAGIVAVVAAAYTGASWFVGRQAEHLVRQEVKTYNQQLQGQLDTHGMGARLVIGRYRRGVFSSDVVYRLSIKDAQGKTREIKLADHLDHGPFPASELLKAHFQPLMVVGHERLMPTPATRQWFDSRADKAHAPVHALTALGFSGTGHSVWHFQPFKSADGRDAFSGGKATIDLTSQFHDGRITAAFDRLRMAAPHESLRLKDVRIEGRTTPSDSGSRVSHAAVTVGQLVHNALTVKNWRVAVEGVRTGDILEGKVHYRLGHVQYGSADWGKILLVAQVSHFDAKALKELGSAYRQVYAQATPTMAQKQILRDKMMAFLAPGPVVSIERFKWQTAKGKSTAKADLHLKKPEVPFPADGNTQRLPNVLKAFDINISVSMPMAVNLLAQNGLSGHGMRTSLADMLVAQSAVMLTRSGMARQEGSRLVSSIHYQGTKVDLNGEKMSLKHFLKHLHELFGV